jgi:hypothetical protein
MNPLPHRSLRRLLGCLIVAAPILAAAPAAHAKGGPVRLSSQATTHTVCQSGDIEHPFASWDDTNDYFLAYEGDVGVGDAWDLGGAQIVGENNPYSAHPTPAASVKVDAGESATTTNVCVAIDDPTMRFFARDVGAGSGVLHVDVIYQDEVGNDHTVEIGQLDASAGGDWAPSPVIDLSAPLVDVLGSGYTPVQFRFRADGAGSSWLVDDVYVDPYGKG